LLLPDLAWTAIGTKWAFDDDTSTNCPSDAVAVVRTVVILSWLQHLALIIFVLLVFQSHRSSQKKWKRRFCIVHLLHYSLKHFIRQLVVFARTVFNI